MKVGIPNIEHKVYSNTFLEQVVLKLNFEGKLDGKYHELKDFFLSRFGLQFSQGQFDILKFKSLRIDGENAEIWLKFDYNFVQVRIGGESYASFKDSLYPIFSNALDFAKILEGTVSRVSLQKVNAWPTPISNNNRIPEFINIVFSQPLKEKLIDQNIESSMILGSTLKNHDSDSSILLNFGFYDKDDNNPYPKLLLDAEAMCDNPNLLTYEQINTTINQMNQDLFNIFHWAVTPKVIEVMDTSNSAE